MIASTEQFLSIKHVGPNPGLEVVDRESIGYQVRACGCKSRFCKQCCVPLGLKLCKRVEEAVKHWCESIMMLTFTVDPTLFDGPAEAWRYIRSNRCISRLMGGLSKRGHLVQSSYFSVVEWHKSGWPHWHVLVNADFIPFNALCEEWNKFRPESAGPVVGDRPGFGSVQFSKRKGDFNCPEHAARYACKYVTKWPEDGFPDWVFEHKNVTRYTASRGFFGGPKKEKSSEPDFVTGDESPAECDVEAELEQVAEEASKDEPYLPPSELWVDKWSGRHRNIGDQVANCNVAARVFEVFDVFTEKGEVFREYRFVGPCRYKWGMARRLLLEPDGSRFGWVPEQHLKTFLIDPGAENCSAVDDIEGMSQREMLSERLQTWGTPLEGERYRWWVEQIEAGRTGVVPIAQAGLFDDGS